jgi:hypothetical protein
MLSYPVLVTSPPEVSEGGSGNIGYSKNEKKKVTNILDKNSNRLGIGGHQKNMTK